MRRVLLLFSWLGGAAACGASPVEPPGSPAGPAFGDQPFAEVATMSGALRMALWLAPDPPVKGRDAVRLSFTDGAGDLPADLSVAVQAWMPAHGHGTSTEPTTSNVAPGVFVADPLYLFMSGRWEVRVTISGAAADTATVNVDVP